MNDYYFIVSGWGIPPNNNIQSKAYIQDVRGIDPCTFLQKKYLKHKNIDSTHTKPWPWNWVWHSVTLPKTRWYIPQNWWLEDYLPIRLWFFSFWQTEKIFKHVCFWNALQTRSLTLRIHQSHIIMTHLRCLKNVTIFLRNSQCFHLRTKIFFTSFLGCLPILLLPENWRPKAAVYTDFSILASCRTQRPWPHSDKSKDSGHIHSLEQLKKCGIAWLAIPSPFLEGDK